MMLLASVSADLRKCWPCPVGALTVELRQRGPPQLPKLFIQELSIPGEFVLDPMAGSGTTLVEAVLSDRCGIGIDLDPLASMIAKAEAVVIRS